MFLLYWQQKWAKIYELKKDVEFIFFKSKIVKITA